MKAKNLILLAAVCCLFSFQVKAQDFELFTETVDLFNGKDLTGWELVINEENVDPADVFTVKDGVIHVKGKPFGFMQTEKSYADFHLYVEWRWPETATNSGIFLFLQDEKKVWSNCIEMQLHAGDAGDFVLMAGADMKEFVLEAGQKRPAFPVVKKKKESSEHPVGEWNSAEIFCFDGHVMVFINGVYQNHGKATTHIRGRIALQSEGEAIEFRNVRLTPIVAW